MSVQEEKLKAIADAIREAEGTTDPIIADEFANRIRNLTVNTGGMSVTVEVEVEDGATVTATQGDTVITTTSVGGVATFTLNQFGNWSIQSFRGDKKSKVYILKLVGEYRIQQVIYNGELVYKGKGANLYNASSSLAATTVGNYAIFAGGFYVSGSTTYVATANSYDELLSYKRLTNLNQSGFYLNATTVGDYALFGGGGTLKTSNNAGMTAYDATLNKTFPENLSIARRELAATSLGDYALFAGGAYGSSSTATTYNQVDVYDNITNKIDNANMLNVAKRAFSGETIGNYAIFAGGFNASSSQNGVDVYDSSINKVEPSPVGLSEARQYMASATVGNYAIFAGGFKTGTGQVATVDAYDELLNKISLAGLDLPTHGFAGANIGNFAVFGGGSANGVFCGTIYVYDEFLTKVVPAPSDLSAKRGWLAATSVGNYIIFGGGQSSTAATYSSYSNVTDVYEYK